MSATTAGYLYGIVDTKDGLIVFDYTTEQGNEKALFFKQEEAQQAIDKYLGSERFIIHELGMGGLEEPYYFKEPTNE